MDASVVGIRLASGVVTPLVRKLFRQEEAGAGLVDRPHRISSYVAWREKRGLGAADLRRLADRLVEEALRAPGERPLPPGEEAGVAAALAATLYALGDLTLSDVEAVRLGPQAFARQLRAAAPHPGLSRDAELFHSRLVDLACLHILNFFTRRSTFVASTLVEQSRLHAETIAKVDELLTRLPRQDGRDTAFEARYLDYLARRHSALTIFGLDLEPGSSRWPLDAAYVSLEVTAAPGTRAEALPAPYSLPAERLPAEHHRVLLRGEAGSGKTTLIQWLAVSAARDSRAGTVPFVLPLRSLTRHGERLPAPHEFQAGSPLAGEAPEGWEGRVLRDGRALLLVDGVDEIPAAERDRARDWLANLMTAYPGNRWLVTSRPSAVRPDWLRDEDFTEVTLAPMSRANVGAFIERWHTAAAAPEGYADLLLDSVRTKPDLARLATNPLLCGLICALHRERRGFLPAGRKELYTAALSMLLHRRDRERGLRLPDLAEEPQLQLLQRLAHWLIRNGRTEMDRSRAEDLIAGALPAVPVARVLGEAPLVYRHFLERTGLLRAPTEDTVEFVHRTFQDYLGARAALDEGGVGELAGHSDDDQWEDVIRMAVAQGRPRERTEIIRALLDRGTDRSVLLAYASLQFAAELDPALRAEAEAAVRHLLPPRNIDEAQELGRTGPLVLELLADPGTADDHEALMAVTAAGETVSELAIPYLARFHDSSSPEVRRALVSLWGRFDTRAYAREVLARLTPPPTGLLVRTDTQADALCAFAGPPGLVVGSEVTRPALSELFSRVRVSELSIDGHRNLGDLDFLRGQTSLERLRISRCDPSTDVSGLRRLPLRTAHLDFGTPGVHEAIATWDHLSHLELYSPQPWSARRLAPGARLVHLVLDTPAADVTDLGRHTELRVLNLGHRWRPAGPADWAELSRLERLEELAVPEEALEGLVRHVRLPALRTLQLYGDRTLAPGMEERLGERFPGAVVEPYGPVGEQ
ncbi:NACHT domain-containing protein [Streptomyces sp. NBC_00160]|uniref:NACHT domain-containing protein n=1 Tax=Streptomyces sp. NBC_00160 TaxID=2903628 RepID=UPI00224D5802|nr:NACHT domain-containing protein [Streptomyces sp. NBC_00160]MCX5304542.1 NACHT domain-containing protein [Streptomyces sp. NBC_00160]